MNWIFYHVEKTGGLSLCRYLVKALGPSVVDVTRTCPDWPRYQQTVPVVALVGHGTYYGMHHEKLDWTEEPTAFTILRDPAERLWSQYKALYRRNIVTDFRRWVRGETYRLCFCLACFPRWGQATTAPHRTNPTVRNLGARWGEPTMESAVELLKRSTVVLFEDLVRWQTSVLFPALGLDGTGYEHLNRTPPDPISDDDRQLVYRLHPEGLDLYRIGCDMAWA